jgi:hypothetical protein
VFNSIPRIKLSLNIAQHPLQWWWMKIDSAVMGYQQKKQNKNHLHFCLLSPQRRSDQTETIWTRLCQYVTKWTNQTQLHKCLIYSQFWLAGLVIICTSTVNASAVSKQHQQQNVAAKSMLHTVIPPHLTPIVSLGLQACFTTTTTTTKNLSSVPISTGTYLYVCHRT